MSLLKLTLPDGESAVTGKQISFVAPCDCTGITGIQIGSTTYTLVDAMNNAINNLGSVFCSGSIVSVLLDCSNRKAFILNASITPYTHPSTHDASILKGQVAVANGGTGKASWTANRLVYPSGSTSLTQLAFPSSAGSVLRQGTSGAPYWTSLEDLKTAMSISGSSLKYQEIKRFTTSGTFNSSSFPSVGYVYDVIIIGGGGSGGKVNNYASNAKAYSGGGSGISICLGGVYIRPGVDHIVAIGAGGEEVSPASYSGSSGRNGGDTSFLGIIAKGGYGGSTTSSGGSAHEAQYCGPFVGNPGTFGLRSEGGKGGDSILAAGGSNGASATSGGQAGSLGSGGGSGPSGYAGGAGGDGVVCIYGLVES